MLKGKLIDRATQVRFLRFAVSGLTVMAVQVGGLALFLRWLGETLAFAASYAVAVVAHYSLNRFWALRSPRTDVVRQSGEYALTVAAGFLTNYALFKLAIGLFHLPPLWATLVTSAPSTLIVFLVLNFRVFRA